MGIDPFALVLLGALGAFVLALWLLGKYYPGSGLEQVGLRSAREISETREALEAEDLNQMIAARNARRRARGEAEITAEDMELRVTRELHEQRRRQEVEQRQRQEQQLANSELDQLLEVTNARRTARGLPPRSREQAREEFGAKRPPAS